MVGVCEGRRWEKECHKNIKYKNSHNSCTNGPCNSLNGMHFQFDKRQHVRFLIYKRGDFSIILTAFWLGIQVNFCIIICINKDKNSNKANKMSDRLWNCNRNE